METIIVTSIIRNGMSYLDRYMAQVAQLRMALSDTAMVIHAVAEGDSTDATWRALSDYALQRNWLHLVKADHGGALYGSVNNGERWRNIALTWNRLFDAVMPLDFDKLLYVESDLIWTPSTMVALLDRLNLPGIDVIAPMSMRGDYFYDTWGHRARGLHFSNLPPFHPMLADGSNQLHRIDSAGSCKAMRGIVARQCRFSEVDAMIGHDVHRNHFAMWLDSSLRVEHP